MNKVYNCLIAGIIILNIMAFKSMPVNNDQVKLFSWKSLSGLVNDTTPNKSFYRDLNTGENIDIWYDATGLRTLNKKTGAPVEFYINDKTSDTVIGRGKFIVNGYVVKGDDGKWLLDDGKVKVDGDELKIKVGDQKFKIDGDEIKIKGNGTKVKSDDGEVKVKSKDGKAKYEDDKIKVKTNNNKTDSTKIRIDN